MEDDRRDKAYVEQHHARWLEKMDAIERILHDEPDPNDMMMMLGMVIQRIINRTPDELHLHIAQRFAEDLIKIVRMELQFPPEQRTGAPTRSDIG